MAKPEIKVIKEEIQQIKDNITNGFTLSPLDLNAIDTLQNNTIFLRASDNKLCLKNSLGTIQVITLV